MKNKITLCSSMAIIPSDVKIENNAELVLDKTGEKIPFSIVKLEAENFENLMVKGKDMLARLLATKRSQETGEDFVSVYNRFVNL